MTSPSDRRAQLLGWIASSRRLQLRLGVALTAGVVASFVVMPFHALAGKLALAMLAIFAVCAYWVTGSHILDWRGQLETLDQAARGRPTQARR